jgi:hypothetical protein
MHLDEYTGRIEEIPRHWRRSKRGNLYRSTDRALFVIVPISQGSRAGQYAVMVKRYNREEFEFLPGNPSDEAEALELAESAMVDDEACW